MDITYKSTDFNGPDNTAIVWYDADGETIGVAFTGWTCDQSGKDDCTVSLLDVDGYPINDNDAQYTAMGAELREIASNSLPDLLDLPQMVSINAYTLNRSI